MLARFFVAEQNYAATPSEENWQALAGFLDPEFVLYQAASLPYGGEWRGGEGFRKWLATMAESWQHFAVEASQVLIDGETVIIIAQVAGASRANGQSLTVPVVEMMKLRDLRLLEVRPFYWDTAALSRALSGAQHT